MVFLTLKKKVTEFQKTKFVEKLFFPLNFVVHFTKEKPQTPQPSKLLNGRPLMNNCHQIIICLKQDFLSVL